MDSVLTSNSIILLQEITGFLFYFDWKVVIAPSHIKMHPVSVYHYRWVTDQRPTKSFSIGFFFQIQLKNRQSFWTKKSTKYIEFTTFSQLWHWFCCAVLPGSSTCVNFSFLPSMALTRKEYQRAFLMYSSDQSAAKHSPGLVEFTPLILWERFQKYPAHPFSQLGVVRSGPTKAWRAPCLHPAGTEIWCNTLGWENSWSLDSLP